MADSTARKVADFLGLRRSLVAMLGMVVLVGMEIGRAHV